MAVFMGATKGRIRPFIMYEKVYNKEGDWNYRHVFVAIYKGERYIQRYPMSRFDKSEAKEAFIEYLENYGIYV